MNEGTQALCPREDREQSRGSERFRTTWTSELLIEDLALTQAILKIAENDELCHHKACKTNTQDKNWG